MSTRIQVILEEEDLEKFRYQARLEGVSLSAWLRAAGRERLERKQSGSRIGSPQDLTSFFQECDEREGDKGKEPDWEEHLTILSRSKRAGDTGT